MEQPTRKARGLGAFAATLALLLLCFLINYLDRGNVSIAGPLIQREFALTDSQLGLLFATFFVSYTAGQFGIGWLIDRFDVNRILAAGFLLWSLATATTGIVRGFAMLLAMRLVLGIGEAVAVPAGSKIIAQHLAEHHRGFASGLVMSGLKIGNALGTLFAGLLMARVGWRPVFVWIGLGSLLWLPAWEKWKPHTTEPTRVARTGAPGMPEILRQRSFWGTSLGHFCSNYLFYFMITWLPTYLVRERQLSMGTMARVAGLYYLVDAVAAVACGWVQDLLIRGGHPISRVRKAGMGLGFGLAAIAVWQCAQAGADSYRFWLLIAGVGCGMTASGLYTFPQALAGPHAVGKWFGWQNAFGNFAGVIGPALTGFVVQGRGNFLAPFAITAVLSVVGVIAWVFVVGRLEPIDWQEKQPAFLTQPSAHG